MIWKSKEQKEGSLGEDCQTIGFEGVFLTGKSRMRWDYLFYRQILARGREYFRSGKVQDLKHTGARYEADVVGTKDYHVTVYLGDRVHPQLSCNCPYAGDGHYCKHMAAVLFAVEEEENMPDVRMRAVEKFSGRVYPFANREREGALQEEYAYFDLAEMTKNILIYEDVYEEAKKLVAEGRLVLEAVETGYTIATGTREMTGVARGYLHGKNRRGEKIEDEIEIRFKKDGIISAICMAEGRHLYEGNAKVCAHVLGILLLLQERLRIEAIGDATDVYASQMFERYRNSRAWRNTGEYTGTVELEPVLERKQEELQVGFRIGKEKKYLLKSLPEFVESVETKGKFVLGKNNQLDFATDRFSEKSGEYYAFIREAVLGEKRRGEYVRETRRQYRESGEETIRGRMALYGQRLDEFFEIAEDEKIGYADKSGYQTVKKVIGFGEGNFRPKLVIAREVDDLGVFQGVRMTGILPEWMQGIQYRYYFEGEQLLRLSGECEEALQPLLEMAVAGKISMKIGRKRLSEFYYRVLPTLREYADIEEKDARTVQRYLPPEVQFVFYLDAEFRNVSCQVKARYGEDEYDVMDWLMPDRKKEIFRDKERENEALECVQKFFPEQDMEKQYFHCANDADRVYRLLDGGVADLMRIGEVQSTDAFRNMNIRKRIPVSLGVSVSSGLMNLEISSTELSQEELLDILSQYRRKKKFFRLKNGDFLKLEDQNMSELVTMLDTLHISSKDFAAGKMQIPLYRALYLDRMLENLEGVYTDRDGAFRRLVKNFKAVEDADYTLPESLRPVLRKYQKYGYRWLRTLESSSFGGILADDMGLGKTLQVIAVLLAAHEEGKTMPALIVTPASLVYNWQEEFAQFAPQLRVGVVAGNQQKRQECLQQYQDFDVLVTSYDLLKRDISEYEDREFAYQVIDEAQYIKNHTTAASKAVKVIRARVKYALTGTPIENRLSELWSIFDYLMPGFLYGYETFKKEIETPIVKNKDAEATERLKRLVSPFILRRLKKDVLRDLPEKLEEIYYAKMEETQQQLYDAQIVHMKQLLKGQSEENYRKNKLQILAEMMKLRQICCDPSLFLENYNGESAKRETCMELIQSAMEGEHKILLFSQFTSMLELLEKELADREIPCYKITGETGKEKRMELVKAFNSDATPVFLISLKAGGTGLNLTGADIVIHYDPWWNLAVQNQATDRAHRIGQTKVVSVYKLIMKNSIEEKILHMQEEKKNLADEILSGETGGIVNMTKEELLELLNE